MKQLKDLSLRKLSENELADIRRYTMNSSGNTLLLFAGIPVVFMAVLLFIINVRNGNPWQASAVFSIGLIVLVGIPVSIMEHKRRARKKSILNGAIDGVGAHCISVAMSGVNDHSTYNGEKGRKMKRKYSFATDLGETLTIQYDGYTGEEIKSNDFFYIIKRRSTNDIFFLKTRER